MDVLSLKEMLGREEKAFESGIAAAALMEAAGEAMALRITTLYPKAQKFVVLTGKGNNGGDGLVVARYLAESGRVVEIILAAPEDQLGELPRTQLERLRKAQPNLKIVPWNDDVVFPDSNGVVIDALLGIQAHGPLRGTLAEIVAKLNQTRADRFFRTVALDFPTGLAAYDKTPAPADRNAAVIADVTIAVGFAKDVLCRESLAGWVGRIEVVPWGGENNTSSSRQILIGNELAKLLPRRNALSHKGDFGRLAIVAGSTGFTGAPVLCAQAAQSMGAGLLSVVTRPDAYPTVAAQATHEAMVSAWTAESDVPAVLSSASAIVVGPGLGNDAETVRMLRAVLSVGRPLLIDADGLNALSSHLDLLKNILAPALFTPHPGEMTQLVGRKFELDEREAIAREFSDTYKITLILKGTRTLIASPGQPIFINTTGNPGLSTGGSGDTLSGILGTLLSQGLSPFDAARLGVWLHGHAADLVLAERGCEEGLTPTMLSAHIGAALVSLRAQAVTPAGLVERAKDF